MGEIFPARITAGLTFAAHVVRPAMPAPEWSVYAILRGPMAININAVPNGQNHVFRVSAGETGNWLAGDYVYTVRAQIGQDVHEIEAGRLTVAPDIQQLQAGHNALEWTEQALQAVEAVILGRATTGQEQYRINNRELRYTPLPELMKLRAMLRRELDQQRRVVRGNLFGDTLRATFRRPA